MPIYVPFYVEISPRFDAGNPINSIPTCADAGVSVVKAILRELPSSLHISDWHCVRSK